MDVVGWMVHNWYTVLSAVGIVGGLLFTAVSLRSETKTRKIANLLALTANHREVWQELFRRPGLTRVIDPAGNVRLCPITPEERAFVSVVVLHVSSAYETLKDELLIRQQGLRRDVGTFFSLPIPRAVWDEIKVLQNADFVAFVEACLREGTGSAGAAPLSSDIG